MAINLIFNGAASDVFRSSSLVGTGFVPSARLFASQYGEQHALYAGLKWETPFLSAIGSGTH